MCGPDIQQETPFSTVTPEGRVPKNHPLRPIRAMVNEALYAEMGRESIPPEKLLRAQLLQILRSAASGC